MQPLPRSTRTRKLCLQTLHNRWWPRLHLFRCSVLRIAGFFPVLIVTCILVLAYVTAVPAALLPLYRSYPFLASALLVLFHFIYANVLINYAVLVFADPGGVPQDWSVSPSQAVRNPGTTDFRHSHLMHERTYDGLLRYCSRCEQFKPDRSHHCSACRRCILRMDHHCIFINNCVSFVNHKFFISFVFYACIGCTFVTIVAFPTMASVVFWPNMATSKTHMAASPLLESVTLESCAIVGYIVCGAFAFALSVFVCFHGYLVTKGRTTIELYETSDPERAARISEYDLGASKNWRTVCGNVAFCWFFPVRAYIDGDGLSWPRNDSVDHDPLLENAEAV